MRLTPNGTHHEAEVPAVVVVVGFSRSSILSNRKKQANKLDFRVLEWHPLPVPTGVLYPSYSSSRAPFASGAVLRRQRYIGYLTYMNVTLREIKKKLKKKTSPPKNFFHISSAYQFSPLSPHTPPSSTKLTRSSQATTFTLLEGHLSL